MKKVHYKETLYAWEGRDRQGQTARGEIRAGGEALAGATLRRQGVQVVRLRRKSLQRSKRISEKDIAIFTRQLATMLKAGVPLLQAFGIVARGQANPALTRLIQGIGADVETGTSLHQAFGRHPRYFDALFCHLVAAGEQAGLLDELLDSLALYQEKTLAIKGKVRAALTYPAAVVAFAVLVTTIIMVWVVPAFRQIFSSFGAELPLPTLAVIAIADFLAAYGWMCFASAVVTVVLFVRQWRRSAAWQLAMDRLLLTLPLFGNVVKKAALARWSRTLAAMFAAGIPLIDALQAVSGAAGNAVYAHATSDIRHAVGMGSSLTAAIDHAGVFPEMVGQMVAIGEESGSLDVMLTKLADFYDVEVNAAVASIASLVEPFIMLVLGVVIGGLVISLYLPIFQLGSVI